MEAGEVLSLLRESGALLEGHFELSSGNRSDRYVQCALALQDPARAAALGVALGEKFHDDHVDVVVGPAMGGIIIANEVARFLGSRCLFTERVEGAMTLRRGFVVEAGEKALVVEDVVTTGGSMAQAIKALEDSGCTIVKIISLVDREAGHVDELKKYDYTPIFTISELKKLAREKAS
ncbi:MAG: orotate phosphoribosyltransferase [Planctomycetota bacterium]